MSSTRRRLGVSIIGLGYVGLSTAVCFASRGIRVVGVDVDAKKLEAIGKGLPTMHEKGLGPLLKRAVKRGDLTCTPDAREAVRSTSVTFLTVGTPSRADGSMDPTYLTQAAQSVGSALANKGSYHVVAVKSTVVPGTSRNVVLPALEGASGKVCGRDFGLVVNPEFLREGSAIEDTLVPDAIVMGPFDGRAERAVTSLYRRFYRKLPPRVVTAPENSELVKYAINTFRGVQLSYLNTLANITGQTPGADVGEVIEGLSAVMGLDSRYLRPGLGFGGSCLSKDLRALVHYGRGTGTDVSLMEAALGVNRKQPSELVGMAEKVVGALQGRTVSVLGLAFKARTDDVRESPALALVEELLSRGAKVKVCDPAATANAKAVLGGRVEYSESAKECVRGSDCCFIATEWPEFRLTPSAFEALMERPVVLDGRRLLDPAKFQGSKVVYHRVGGP